MMKIKLTKNEAGYKCRAGHGAISKVLMVESDEFTEKDMQLFNGFYCPLCIIEHVRSNLGVNRLIKPVKQED